MSSDTVIITIKVDVTGTTQGQKAGLTHFNGGVHYAFCGIADYGNSKHIIYEADGKSKNGPRLPSNLKTCTSGRFPVSKSVIQTGNTLRKGNISSIA